MACDKPAEIKLAIPKMKRYEDSPNVRDPYESCHQFHGSLDTQRLYF